MAHAPKILAQTASLFVTLAALSAPACSSEPVDGEPRAVRAEVRAAALSSLDCARGRGLVAADASVITVIDYSLPSTARRLWVLDAETGATLFNERVTHGKNSGGGRAERFSNVEGSKQSSLGVFRTAETYRGKHGYSLRLDGLEPDHNDNARARAIVIHGADYNSDGFIAEHGRLGRSWGCPALDKAVATPLINTIKEGTLLVTWYPDTAWLTGSTFLHC